MESVLDDHLLDIDWPRDTELSFELSDDGKKLMVDVDLPEIDEFPTTELRVYQRGIGVSVDEREVWSRIHFDNLDALDPVEALKAQSRRVRISPCSRVEAVSSRSHSGSRISQWTAWAVSHQRRS